LPQAGPDDSANAERILHAVQSNVGQQRADYATLRCALIRCRPTAVFSDSGLQPLAHKLATGREPDRLQQRFVTDVVEGSFDVGIDDPPHATTRVRKIVDHGDGVVGASPGTEAVACRLESGLPFGFQRVFDTGLHGPIADGRYP